MGTPMAVTSSVVVNNYNYQKSRSVQADVSIRISKDLAAAKTGQLTTRTDNTTGTLTMTAGHGIITGDRIDIYWNGGSRRGVTVGTVATNSVPISLGAGDDLPVNLTNVTVMVATFEAVVFTGNNLQYYAFKAPNSGRATVVFTDSGGTEVDAVVITAGSSAIWESGSGITNPLAGDSPARIYMTHEDAVNQQTVFGDVGYN